MNKSELINALADKMADKELKLARTRDALEAQKPFVEEGDLLAKETASQYEEEARTLRDEISIIQQFIWSLERKEFTVTV